MKKGESIKIDFHACGEISTETEIVHHVDEQTVIIEAEDERSRFKFDRNTGKCLNDNTYGGAKRLLNPEFINQ